MRSITCPSCGLSFETAATTNTRCRHCRRVVHVGRRAEQLWELGLLLACGHASWCFDWDEVPAAASDYLFTCEQCGAEDQEVVRVLGSVAAEKFADLEEEKLAHALFGEYASTVLSGATG